MAPPSLLYEALCTLVFNFALTGVNAAAALLKPHLPGAAELDDIALVFALVMARACAAPSAPDAFMHRAHDAPALWGAQAGGS
jgi:hypothetical protein